MRQPHRRSFRRFALVVCAVGAGLASGSASAAESSWGGQGRFLLTGALAVQNDSAGGASATELALTPGFRYFAINHLAVGADLQFVHISTGSMTGFALLPALGYDVVLSEAVSIVPQFELRLQVQTGGPTVTRFGVGGFLPVIAHPPGHFFIGFGPEVLADVSSSTSDGYRVSNVTTIGARSIIGAWF